MAGSQYRSFVYALKAEGDTRGFAAFEKLAGETATRMQAKFDAALEGVKAQKLEREFAAATSSVTRLIDNALGRVRTATGSLDLGGDISNARAAADATRARAAAAQELANALRATQGAASLGAKAAQLQAEQDRIAADAALKHADALEQVQAELGKTASASGAYVKGVQAASTEARQFDADLQRLIAHIDPTAAAQANLARSTAVMDKALAQGSVSAATHAKAMQFLQAEFRQNSAATGAQRQAYVQLGQQLQDVAIQAQMGINPFVILTQQGTQAAFAMSQMGGAAGKLGAILGSHWTIAFGLAAAAVYALYKELEATGEAMGQVELATNTLGQSQGALADYFDKGSNAIAGQNELLKLNARLQAINLRSSAQTARAEADKTLGGATNFSYLERFKMGFTNWNNQFNNVAYQNADPAAQRAMRNSANVGNIVSGVRSGALSKEAALRLLETQDFTGLRESKENLMKAIVDMASAAVNEKIAAEIDTSLNQGKLTPAMRKSGKSKASAGARTTSEYENTVSSQQVARLLIEAFGGRITSTDRTKAANDAAGGAKNSYHLTGRAVDFVPAGGMGSITKDQIRAVMQAAGINTKEILGPGDKGHKNHYHIAFSGGKAEAQSRAITEALDRQREAERRHQEQMKEFAEDTSNRVASMRNSFAEITPYQRELNQQMRQLDDLSTDVGRKLLEGLDPETAKRLNAEIEAMRRQLPELLRTEPLRDMVKQSKDRLEIDRLILAGRYDEADVARELQSRYQDMSLVRDDEYRTVLAIAQEERRRSAQIRDQREIFDAYLASVRDMRAGLEATVASAMRGKLSAKSLLRTVADNFINIQAKVITEQLFGPMLREMEDALYGGNKVDRAATRMTSAMDTGSVAVQEFANAVSIATQQIASGGVAANDNGGPAPLADVMASLKLDETLAGAVTDIGGMIAQTVGGSVQSLGNVIMASVRRTSSGQSGTQTPGSVFTNQIDSLLKTVGIKLPKALNQKLGLGLDGFAQSALPRAALSALGVKQSSTGAMLGGIAGAFLPGGPIIGSIIGSVIGGLFKKTPKGSLTLSNSGGSYSGSGKLSSGLTGLGDSVSESLSNIAEQLGGSVGSFSSSIRQKGKKYYVGGQKFTDADDAARALLLQSIQNGALVGIRQGAQRLLQSGKDIEAQLSKALKLDDVFRRLKAYDDPMGAALDDLDREFSQLKTIFVEAGEDLTELERLYGKERVKVVEEVTAQMTSALRGLLNDLTIGDNGLSLRDRRASALANYSPLAADMAAGKKVDYDKYASAAQQLLQIEREIFGSQPEYFARLKEVTDATKRALGDQSGLAALSAGRESLFANDNAVSASTAIDTMNQNLSTIMQNQLSAVNYNLAALPDQIAAKLAAYAPLQAANGTF